MSKILHVLDHSLPEMSGYASRSHSILLSLKENGAQLVAMTSAKQESNGEPYLDVGGVQYLRSTESGLSRSGSLLGQLASVVLTRNAIRRNLAVHDIEIVHAHSPCLNGLAALGLGKPVVYEMRSSWEDAAVSSGTTTEGSLRYTASKWLETFVARKAHYVSVICEGLKTELVTRGVPADKIVVVPNALPEDMFVSADQSSIEEIRTKYELYGCKVIGFFGSFFEWEGVGDLIKALPLIAASHDRLRVLLVGGGRQEPELRNIVEELGLGEVVIFTGRVPPATVKSFYGVADVMAFPRVASRLTDMVTPLKPLEAMAQGVPVVASSVGGHKELIRDGETGFLYPAGDTAGLANTVLTVLQGAAPVREIVTKARSWVENERRWDVVARKYLPIYTALERTGD